MLNTATHHVLGFTVKLVLAVYFLFVFVFLFLRYAVLPNIDYYKPDIERAASRALGNEVSIARVYASWQGQRPNLFLGDVVLRDRQGRELLALPSISATLSWWSVAALAPRFASIELIRPELAVRRDVQGKLFVAGIALADTRGGGGGANWLLSQREIVVRQGRLRWTDELRGAPPLALENLNLALYNNWTHHRFALTAAAPAALASPLDIRADFTHRFGADSADATRWKGELFVDLRGADFAVLGQYVDAPVAVSEGRGSLRAWLTLDQAKLAAFTADVGLSGVKARLGRTLAPLELARVSGRVSAREHFPAGQADGKPTFGARGHDISLADFGLETADGLTLRAAALSERFTAAAGGRQDRYQLSASELDLKTLARLAAQLPISASQRQALADFAPRGRLLGLDARWEGTYPALANYRVRARVDGLGIAAQPARLARPNVAPVPALPGFDNLSGSIDVGDQGGSVQLDSRKLVLQLPGWFADPAMPFDHLGLRARWSFLPQDELLVQVDAMEFAQGALRGKLSGRHQMPLQRARGGTLGRIDLDASVDGFAIDSIGRYLPLQTPPRLRAWLTGALLGGTGRDVTLKLRGDLVQFPFRAPARGAGRAAGVRAPGEFRVAGRLENASLNYTPLHHGDDGKSPLWPLLEGIDGTILFDRTRMEIKAERARTGGVALSAVKAVVPDLMAGDMQLEIDGAAAAPLQEFLHYVAASPVLGWIGRFTEHTKATGNARLALRLRLPLARLAESTVQGALQLANNDVVLIKDLPPLQSTLGKIEFTERSVNLNGVGASFLGGPLALTGGTLRDRSIAIKLGGTVSGDGLRASFKAPAVQRLLTRFSGATRYAGLVTVKERALQVTLDSNMAGLGLDFPAPLRKTAPEALPVHFTLASLPGAAGLARDEIRLTLGSSIAARYLRQKAGDGPWRVLRGGIGVNLPPPEPDSGVIVNVNMKSLNVDQWSAVAGTLAAGPAEAAASAAAGGALELGQYILPDMLAARATELIIGERKLDNVVVGATRQNDNWQASIDARQVAGHVAWVATPNGLGKVTARLATLLIPESAKAEVKDLLEGGKGAAATIPALDIVAERFELFNKQLGRLELLASNVPALAGREWRINKLSLITPDGELKAAGKWLTKDGRSSTNLNFVLDIGDAGRLLDRFGFPDTLKHGKGKLNGDIAWNGVPYTLDAPSLSGQIELDLAGGQFLKQDPGAAKLLGVLSLQALPRLLKLDFHDVFSQGLAFDGISADAVIAKGVIRTNNLKMHGLAATVLMEGTADVANETTNLHVIVIPEFNLGTGPLVYALAINPIVGLGGYLAQLFLRAPMMKAMTYHMRVAGPWKAPVITKLDKNGKPKGAPAPAAAPAVAP
ncbi:TIGR02099 family protein [Massilia glaciei]|uniref:TIGR02099 family protein n=2 Tax=Massilia glaciei TaxID=1524097 RepID=A0A2U2I5E6_9BURK|nr:TIGR02099 family protein [Massilia glaciei]